MAKKTKAPRSRGQIIPKGEGRWLVRFYLGRGPDGKRVYPSELVTGTFSQAQKALTKLLTAHDTQSFVPPSKLTLQEHCDAWLSTKVSLGPKTIREYRNRLTKDVYPSLGKMTLASLSGPIIQTWSASLTARGLSPRTVEFSHTVLKASLEYAVRHGIILRNPCAYTELPRKVHHEQAVFSPEQAASFLSHTTTSRWHPLWCLLLTTGLRPQEALALQWTDLDLTTRTVQVRRALVEVAPGVYEPGQPKTERSTRAVSIPEAVVQVFTRYRARTGGVGGAWVFSNEAHSHYDLSTVRKAWKRDIRLANAQLAEEESPLRLPEIRLYGARHTHFTHLLSLGVHPKAAADRAGHSSTTVTLNTYSHVLPQVDREAGDKVGVLLFTKEA